MTNLDLDEIPAPKEVIDFFRSLKCPICRSQLDIKDPNVFGVDKNWFSFTSCIVDAFHYEVGISWKDPKYIIIDNETVDFEYKLKNYKIKINYTWHDAVLATKDHINEITVTPIDVDGSSLIGSEEVNFTELGKIFNLKKFSKEEIANRVNVMMVFG